ncbi:hypothetical protein Ciccas_002444 [Cichlidogyrus casuarinus]|uniref:Uncharacterized protein n=1 Tax=Cichlidogyrus casuarinus TaxID=1844966 RepID=A0ABD2QHT8_9PLAT
MADPYGIGMQQNFGQFQYAPAGAGDQAGQFMGFPMSQGAPGPNMFGPQSLAFEPQGRPSFTDPTGMGLGASPAVALQPGMGADLNSYGAFGEMSLGSQMNAEGLRDDTVFISGLPQNVDHEMIKKEFGVIGKIKMNAKTSMPMVWIFKEKGIPRGDGLVTFEDPSCVQAAIEHFSSHQITVKQATNAQRPVIIPPSNGSQPMMGGMMCYDDPMSGRRGPGRGGAIMGRGGMMDSKRSGDWTCMDCNNVNFAWREACNRCGRTSDQGGMMMDGGMGMNLMMHGGPKSMINITSSAAQGRGNSYAGRVPTISAQMRGMNGARGGGPGPMGFGAGALGAPNSRAGGVVQTGGAMMMLTPQGAGPGMASMGRGGGPLRALGGTGGPGGRPRPAPY